MNPLVEDYVRSETRRQFLTRGKNALGTAAMASLLGAAGARSAYGAPAVGGAGRPLFSARANPGLPNLPHFAPKAKSVIYLHMVGGAFADGSVRL